ncbi:MAG: cupredoxin domain-containing protein [Solirubrobacterales bacterium]|nr:cupredoxin domain-containing protein [Solirubrobacterales bacterium]
MSPLRKIILPVLVVILGALSALALSACSDDEVLDDDASQQVDLALSEFDIAPSRVAVTAGEIEFVIKNDGDRVHELAVKTASDVKRSGEIKPGESATMTVDLPRGTYTMYDPQADYRSRGMTGSVVVSAETATVTERTVERTVVEEPDVQEPEIDDPELQEPEAQEPEVQQPPAQPAPPPVTVTKEVPAPPPPPDATTTP